MKKDRNASKGALTERIKLNRVVTISFSWILPTKPVKFAAIVREIAKKDSQKFLLTMA